MAARPNPRPTRAQESLTKRELEIVALICQGANNHEIASELGISEQTVRNQLGRIYDKLRVRDRIQLIIKYPEFGASSLSKFMKFMLSLERRNIMLRPNQTLGAEHILSSGSPIFELRGEGTGKTFLFNLIEEYLHGLAHPTIRSPQDTPPSFL